MNLKELKALIKLVAEKQFAEFELEQPDFKLRIRRTQPPVIQPLDAPSSVGENPAAPVASAAALEPTPPPSVPTSLPAAAAPPAVVAREEEEHLHIVTSPIVGTFYRASSPTSPPFVEVGDHVEPGTVLCIIEAMKLMTEISSETAGEIVQVIVENGQPVEYGQPLFAIRVNSR